MKKFKIYDAWISTGLIISFTSLFFLDAKGAFAVLFSGYFVVGAWQVISMLVHVFNKRTLPVSRLRSGYHLIALVAVATMPVGSFFLLLYVAPVMAVFYTWLCFSEVKKLNGRPLSCLK